MKDLNQMIAGFRQFQKDYFVGDEALFNDLKKGQNPRTLVIGCSDSRVDPALLTGANPGDLFVIRNVANLVPPCRPDENLHGVSAAIEYAVTVLKVEHIVVLGHSECGGIRGMLAQEEGAYIGDFVGPWVSLAKPAVDNVRHEMSEAPIESQAKALELESILLSLENLLTFPFVQQAIDEGRLALHGWYVDITLGALLHYDAKNKAFEPLVQGVFSSEQGA